MLDNGTRNISPDQRFYANMILFVPRVALTALAAAAVRIWTSALNVKYRDIRCALAFALQILMF
jgi:ABC-type polysaccharide/polyol phosphate export permease